MTEKFDFEQHLLIEDELEKEEEGEIRDDVIKVQSDEDDVEGNDTVAIDQSDSCCQIKCIKDYAEVPKDILYQYFLSVAL